MATTQPRPIADSLSRILHPVPRNTIDGSLDTVCVICHGEADDPVRLPCACRFVYCRECISLYFACRDTCPTCKQTVLVRPALEGLQLLIRERFAAEWRGALAASDQALANLPTWEEIPPGLQDVWHAIHTRHQPEGGPALNVQQMMLHATLTGMLLRFLDGLSNPLSFGYGIALTIVTLLLFAHQCEVLSALVQHWQRTTPRAGYLRSEGTRLAVQAFEAVVGSLVLLFGFVVCSELVCATLSGATARLKFQASWSNGHFQDFGGGTLEDPVCGAQLLLTMFQLQGVLRSGVQWLVG